MYKEIHTAGELEHLIDREEALLVFFSGNTCSVCDSLKPKVDFMIGHHFPNMKSALVAVEAVGEAAGQHRIFSVPVILVFFKGKETIRKTGSFSISELIRQISRPYSLLFSE